MSWNYRIIRHVEPDGEEYFAIHEVYYDDAGTAHSMTERASHPAGSTLNELRRDFGRYQQALARPVLDAAYFESEQARAAHDAVVAGEAPPQRGRERGVEG